MQSPQVRFEEGEGGSLAISKLCLKGLTGEEDVRDNQYTAQYTEVTPVFSQACADLWMPALLSGYLNCSQWLLVALQQQAVSHAYQEHRPKGATGNEFLEGNHLQ